MTIVASGSIAAYFNEAVEDALRSQGISATGGATHYLVSLLADFARPDERAEETLDRPLAFLLDEALHTAAPAERFERLRVLGDGVLYGCGFFGEHFTARGVEKAYLISIGATAYGTASSMLHRRTSPGSSALPESERTTQARSRPERTPNDVFSELAEKFASFVSVLADIADLTLAKGAAGSRGLVRLYERWLQTGSGRIAHELHSQGLLPVRGPKGVVQ